MTVELKGQWVPARNLHKVRFINILSWAGELLIRLCLSLRTYSHIMPAGIEVTVFNGVVTGKSPLLKYLIVQPPTVT